MEHLTEQEIAQCAEALYDGTYEGLPLAVKEHLASCDDCANEVTMVAELANEIEIDQKKTKRPLRLWLAISGAAAASVIIFVIGNNLINNSNNNQFSNTQIAKSDSTLQNTDTSFASIDTSKSWNNQSNSTLPNVVTVRKEVLAAYQPNKDLEKLTDNYKQAYRGDNIVVLTKNEFTYSESDSLKWENPDSEKLIVELFNNTGEKFESVVTTSNGVNIPKLKSGLYYWKLINEDYDLLYCGKFTVKQ